MCRVDPRFTQTESTPDSHRFTLTRFTLPRFTLTYLRLLNLRLGLLINFHTFVLKDRIFRVVNNLAPLPAADDGDTPDLRA